MMLQRAGVTALLRIFIDPQQVLAAREDIVTYKDGTKENVVSFYINGVRESVEVSDPDRDVMEIFNQARM